jgi:hypothetical protein
VKTHVLRIENGSGLEERKVDGQARLIIRAGPGRLESIPLKELDRAQLEEGFADEHFVLYLAARGRASYKTLPRGSRLELDTPDGTDSWPVSELVSFLLAPIPPKPQPEAPPLSRTWRVRRFDGSEEVVTLAAGVFGGKLYEPTHPEARLGGYVEWEVPLSCVASVERIEEP